MFTYRPGRLEFVRSTRRSTADVFVNFTDRNTAELFLRQFKSDCLMMLQLRSSWAQTERLLFQQSDDEVIAALASQLALGELLLRDPGWESTSERPSAQQRSSVSAALAQRHMSGYFTVLKYILGARSFEHLEDLLGYRRGRLSAKGLLIYRFLRLPEIDEFEVRGYTNTPEDKWNDPKKGDAKIRKADLARNTVYPSFDEIQKNHARDTMTTFGDNTLVKVYPLDRRDREAFPPGHGIPQWRLTTEASRRGPILGALLFYIHPGSPLPWVE